MDLKEYQAKARSTAIYLRAENSRMLYPALGIVGECGEVAEKTKKLIRDADWEMTPDRIAAITKELGDCCWYAANICCDTDLDLEMMYKMRGHSILQQIRGLPFPRLALHMNRHATAVATSLEQWYYQHDCRVCERGHHTDIPNHLSHIMTCIEEIARRCGFTLEEIYVANIENLAGRKQRGTLKGDGDNR